MKLIIDIPDYEYKHIREYYEKNDVVDATYSYIYYGTPLPKGHGRLIDADKVKEELKEHHDFFVNAYGGFSNLPRNDKSRVDEITSSIATIVNAPTIIEADKGE